MTIYEFDPTRAGAGDHTEIISAKLRYKTALVDVQTDEKDTCFKWSFIAARKNFKKDCTKEDLLPFENEFNFESLQFPVDIYCDTISKQHTFRKFEIANDTSVNIYTVKNYEELVKPKKKKKSKKVQKSKSKTTATTTAATSSTTTVTAIASIDKKRKKNKSAIIVPKKKKKSNPFIIREAVDEDDDDRSDDSDDETEIMDFIDDGIDIVDGEDPSFFININRTLNEKEEEEEEEEKEEEEEEI